jgi:hypothetical protein
MVDHENQKQKRVHYTYNLIQIYMDIFAHSADPTADSRNPSRSKLRKAAPGTERSAQTKKSGSWNRERPSHPSRSKKKLWRNDHAPPARLIAHGKRRGGCRPIHCPESPDLLIILVGGAQLKLISCEYLSDAEWSSWRACTHLSRTY